MREAVHVCFRVAQKPQHRSLASNTLQEREHLLCLNQQEALMLFGLLQAALRHEPSRQTLLSSGDYKQFHRQLSQALAKGLANAEAASN